MRRDPRYQQRQVVLFLRLFFQLELGSNDKGFSVIDLYISINCWLSAEYFLVSFSLQPFDCI